MGCGVVTMVNIGNRVEVRFRAPVVPGRALDQHTLLTHDKIFQGVGSCTNGALAEVGPHVVKAPMYNGTWIVIEVFRNGQHRTVQMQSYHVIVKLLDSTTGYTLRQDGLAVWTSLTRLCGAYHGVEQPEIGRTNARVKPAGDVVHHIVGVEHIAIGPAHPPTQLEGPGT